MTRYPGLALALAWSAAIAGAVVLIPPRSWLGVVALGATLPLLAVALVLRPAVLAVAIAVALLAVARVELPVPDAQAPVRAASVAGQTAVMTGRIADDSRARGGGGEVLVEPTQVQIGVTRITDIGNLLVRWRGPANATYGDMVRATGKLTLPRDTPDFDRRAYLGQRNVYLELQASSFDVTSSERGVAAIPSWLRSRYTAALNAAVPPPHAAMLLGIVLGVREGVPPRLEQALIATGLIHLLVLSGLKVAVFARIIQGTLRPILGRHATWPVLGLIAVYAMAGGATPAAVRASVMGGLAIAAAHMGRPSHVWTSLALTAAAMLGWHPELAWDVGFQLSFAGTAAIILLTPAIARRVAFLPHILREPFAVTCAAQVGTLPMMATDFHVISPIAPVANALTLPVLPVLVASGLVLSVLSVAPELARAAAIPIAGLLAYIEQVGYVLARAPLAAFSIPSFPTWLGLAYYSALAPAIAGGHTPRPARWFAFAAAAIGPVLISTTALVGWANAPPQAFVLNVGDGQAVLLRDQHGAILIDGGPSPQKLRDELGTLLPPWQRNLDGLIITAPGLGHVGGLTGFDRSAQALFSRLRSPDPPGGPQPWSKQRAAPRSICSRPGSGSTSRALGWRSSHPSPAPPETRWARRTSLCARLRQTARASAISATWTSRRRRSRPRGLGARAATSCCRAAAGAGSRPISNARPSDPRRSSSPHEERAGLRLGFHPTCCAPTRRARSPCRCKYDRPMPRATRQGIATALLLHGEERFLVDERSRATIDQWRTELVSDFGLEVLEGAGLTPARLQDAVLQVPFLDPYRVVFARMIPANRAEGLAPALAQIPVTTRVLVTVAGRLGSTNKLTKAITAAGGQVDESQHLKGRALSDWASRRAVEKHGLTANIAAQVVRVSPPDLSVVDSELTKLAAYKASGSKLTPEVVTELLAGGREDEIFKLTDNLLPRPGAAALEIARHLTRSGLQPTSVAYRMARHYALVLEVKARQDRGESLQQVQDDMTEHRFVIQKAFDAAQNASPQRLEDALKLIRDYEWEVKSGQVDAELGLDVLLTRL